MDVQVQDWDVVTHLDSREAILAYIDAAFEDGDPDLIAVALDDVEKVQQESSPLPKLEIH